MIKDKANLLKIVPTTVDTLSSKFIQIDDTFVAGLFISNYNREMDGGFLDNLISSEVNFNLSMFYEKKSKQDLVNKLTGYISNVGADIKTSNSNQVDIDMISTIYENAKYIKRQIQVEDDDIYYLSIYITTFSKNKDTLDKNIERIESLAIGCGLTARRATFRQEEVFNSTLPIMTNSKELKNISKRNVLTSGLISTYPFMSNELCDDEGVLMGVNALSNSIVMVDRFDTSKYKNGNMCVIGSSGSGKSYFIKLMIARNRLLGNQQFVIDPDNEYKKICLELGGTIIKFDASNVINVMEIREIQLDAGETFLESKLKKLKVFFSIIFKDLTEEEKSFLDECAIECYEKFGITFDNDSLYKGTFEGKMLSKKLFKESSDMPTLGDLYKILKKKNNKLANILKPYVLGSTKFMNNHTTVNLDNKLIIADISNIEEEDLPGVLFIITEFYWDKIKENRGRKKIIYLDEVWKLINRNTETANFVFKIFKTIRKYGGAATAITQDINDFFSLNDGEYGRGILNNSSVKCVFQIEENDIRTLKDILNLSDLESYKLLNNERGVCLMMAGRNHLMVKVISSEYEHKFISTDIKDL